MNEENLEVISGHQITTSPLAPRSRSAILPVNRRDYADGAGPEASASCCLSRGLHAGSGGAYRAVSPQHSQLLTSARAQQGHGFQAHCHAAG
jgi:hypothetical protein